MDQKAGFNGLERGDGLGISDCWTDTKVLLIGGMSERNKLLAEFSIKMARQFFRKFTFEQKFSFLNEN